MSRPNHKISLGAEVETHTIELGNYHIGRHFMLPKKGVLETGESYHRDRSIGIEYASRPFFSIREGLFIIKAGLRKSIITHRFDRERESRDYTLFLAGTWRDRFAASHFHVGLGKDGIEFKDALRLSRHLHGHLPFLIALLANSPVHRQGITNQDSNRFLNAEAKFFHALEYGELDQEYKEEMTYNRSRKKRIPTLEIRPCDANLPEYISAGLVVIKAVTLAFLSRRRPANVNRNELYLKARLAAARKGPRAALYWNNRALSAEAYLDKFFRVYEPFLEDMDIPPEVFEVFRLFKQGWNGAGILRRACLRHQKVHSRTWARYFAEDYAQGITALLSGETVSTFARLLGLRPPSTEGVRLGRLKW